MKSDTHTIDRQVPDTDPKPFARPQMPDEKITGIHQRFPWLVYAGCGFSILLVIIVGATSLYFFNQQKHNEKWVEHTYQVLDNLETVHQNLYEMEISKQGYNNTGMLHFLKNYNTSSVIMLSKINELTASVNDNPGQVNRISGLKKQINELLNSWQTQTNNFKPASNRSTTHFLLVEKSKMDSVNATIDAIAAAEHQLLTHRTSENTQLREMTKLAIIIGTVMILIIVSFLVYFILKELKYRIIAYRREREINQLKSSFVALASHEFRTPLSTISLSAALIEKYGESYNDRSFLKHTARIKTTVNNLKIILEDFLSLEKLDAGNIRAEFASFDLVEFCEEIIDEMKIILRPGQKLCYEHTEVGRIVTLDSGLLRNAIINLISNSVKYGGENVTIVLHTQISNEQILIGVKDDGSGIPEKAQKELFSPFYRVNQQGNVPGTGLGLNIVLRYVKLMNGKITFSSLPHQETRFDMSFNK